MRGGTTL